MRNLFRSSSVESHKDTATPFCVPENVDETLPVLIQPTNFLSLSEAGSNPGQQLTSKG